MNRLTNKNILITGGNSGIGLAAAQEFDREGARVAICGLNEKTLKAAQETLGAGSLAVRADVSNLADLDAMFGRFSGEEQGDAVKGLLRTNNPSKRLADPVEIAKLAVYLASDDSAYVVGADFLIDGGATAISAVGA